MRKLCVAAVVMFALSVPVGANAATPPPGLGGCRQLIGSTERTLTVSTASVLRTAAFGNLAKVKDPKLKKLLVASSDGPLLDWCGAHYPLSSLLGI